MNRLLGINRGVGGNHLEGLECQLLLESLAILSFIPLK